MRQSPKSREGIIGESAYASESEGMLLFFYEVKELNGCSRRRFQGGGRNLP